MCDRDTETQRDRQRKEGAEVKRSRGERRRKPEVAVCHPNWYSKCILVPEPASFCPGCLDQSPGQGTERGHSKPRSHVEGVGRGNSKAQ